MYYDVVLYKLSPSLGVRRDLGVKKYGSDAAKYQGHNEEKSK